jgi:sugar lactone lactonase YvrE
VRLAGRRVLGEGPVWSAAEQAVWFVDIKAPAIHRFIPPRRQAHPGRRRPAWDSCCRRAPAGSPGSRPAASLQPGTGNFTLLHVVEPHAPNNRLNDGFVDREGSSGSARWTTTRKIRAARCTSSVTKAACAATRLRRDQRPAESPDGRTLYHTDTLAGVIYAFDRARNGQLSNKRVFRARSSGDGGYPDGPIVDVEGCV